jgi:Ran GTPase-activating protein (RanGAP) involved in mRNA processing and transport
LFDCNDWFVALTLSFLINIHRMSQDLSQPPDKRRRVSVEQAHSASTSITQSSVSNQNVVTINIQTLSGMLPPVAISAQSTVRDLKLRVQTLNADFAFNRQKLIINEPDSEGECEGVVLLNHQTLYSYHMTESTNVVLVVSPKPDAEVCIDDALKDAERFAALLIDPDLRTTSIKVNSIDRNRELLLQLFWANRNIQSIKISGCWTEEHLHFCESLLALRPDVDIRVDVIAPTEFRIILCVVRLCKSNRFSSIGFTQREFGGKSFQKLTSALESMSSLKTFKLSGNGNQIDADGCRELARALQTMSSLQHLELRDNAIGSDGCHALASPLQSMSSLQHLELRNNVIGAEGCRELAPALQSMSSLQTLILILNQIGNDGCRALAPSLQSMVSLQHLDLSRNGIGAAGSRELAPALQSMSSLRSLDLHRNGIGDECCRALAPALQSMSLLQTLNLSFNQIDAVGCLSLAPALQSMSSLQHLELSSNQTGAEGCRALAPAMQSMSLLQTLNLSVNQIGDDGCHALASALQSMSSLQTLELTHNRIGTSGFAALLLTMQSLPSINVVELSGNRIESAMRSELRSELSFTLRC